MTNSSFSLPNDRRRLLRIGRPVILHESTARAGPSSRPRCQYRLGISNGCNRVASSIFSKGAPWHLACLHGWTEAHFRVGSSIGRSDPAHCVIRKVAECQTEGSGCGRVI